MKKETAYQEITVMLEDMRKILLVAKVRVRRLKFKELKHEPCVHAHKWLKKFFEGSYRDLRAAYLLVNEEMWQHYNNMGVKDMQEQLILNDRIEKTRSTWEGRPAFLKGKQ